MGKILEVTVPGVQEDCGGRHSLHPLHAKHYESLCFFQVVYQPLLKSQTSSKVLGFIKAILIAWYKQLDKNRSGKARRGSF